MTTKYKQSKPLVNSITAPRSAGDWKQQILIGTATLGQIRIEWHNAFGGLVIPVNWQMSMQTPIGFAVADAQNLIVKECLDKRFEWLFLIEDDVIVPHDLFLRIETYMRSRKVPIVSGLYAVRCDPIKPMLFRGKGTGAFTDFKLGDKVWCDGVPTGCLLIHCSVLRVMAGESPTYPLRCNGSTVTVPRVFETPRKVFSDPKLNTYRKLMGTSDLYFCDQIRDRKVLERAGWPAIARKQYPFLVDTAIHCDHIDRETGRIYRWEGTR